MELRMSILKLKVENRIITGKKVKKMRRAGSIPVHMYGNNPGCPEAPCN